MPNINCTEFNELLAQAIESRRSADMAVLREHALACAGCQAAWLDALLLDRAVARWRKAVPAVDLADRVLFRLSIEREGALVAASTRGTGRTSEATSPVTNAAPPRKRIAAVRRGGWAALAAACVALIAIVIGGLGRSKAPVGQVAALSHATSPASVEQKPLAHPTNPNRQKLDRPPVAQPPVVEPLVADTRVDSLVTGAGFAYLNLASQAAGAVTAAAVLVPAPTSNPAARTAADKDGRWVDEVGREFAPVTRNLSDAFEFLLQAMPADKTPAT
jgi:hypothetical protein